MKTYNLLFHISSFVLFFGYSEAIPVSYRTFGEENVALLGMLSCIGVSAVIGLCVFCKKKKGQFKKFENDGNIEEVKNTDYPILKSLHPLDSKKTCAIIPSSPTNLSTDNLLDQTVQYQNESVSSHELEGIENYHLLEYQRETYPKASVAQHLENDCIPVEEQHLSSMQADNESSSNIHLSSKASLSSASPLPGTKTSYSGEQETTSLKNSVNLSDERPLLDRNSTDIEIGADEDDDYSSRMNITAEPPTRLDEVTISISDKVSFYDDPTSIATPAKENFHNGDVTPMDSLEDNSSVHETNSIEEALRALDIAIDGEDETDDSENERNLSIGYTTNTAEIIKDSNIRCHDNHGEKNSSSDSGLDEIEISEKANSNSDALLHEVVREEAIKLVEEVLLLSKKRVEEELYLKHGHFVDKELFEENDFNAFHSGISLKCSTPLVTKKITAVSSSKSSIKNALFCDSVENPCKPNVVTNNVALKENIHFDGQIERIDDAHNETYCTQNEPNVTFPVATTYDDDDDLEQIFPVNKTVTLPSLNDTDTVNGLADTFIKSHSNVLPEIMVDEMNDDAVSDRPTATPMNTPIELGCPTTADWDKWLSASTSTDSLERNNVNFRNCPAYDEGWFLHAQPSHSTAMETNETFDLDESSENLDSMYNLLRKQLTEMLPYAQGAKEIVEAIEESSSPNYYGMQYGDLDEATNAPSSSTAKSNEMIINYKRTLSPIMEESEDESFYNKTSYYKETSNCIESTSTGCMESLTAMGINKTLMASNDTLFNCEDVLDEILSPRFPSQSQTPTNREREISDYFLRSPHHDPYIDLASTNITVSHPQSLDLTSQRTRDSSLGSPCDPTRVDFSQDSTFTLDDKTCISVCKPNDEDERISEISEPILVSSSSCVNRQDDSSSLKDEDIASLEDDSFDEILRKEKSLENDQFHHFLDLNNTGELNMEPPEPDENFDPTCSHASIGAVFLQNKLNLENTFNNRILEEHTVIDSIDRFLLKSRNISLPEDKSTNPLVNGHLTGVKLSSRSDGKNICIDLTK